VRFRVLGHVILLTQAWPGALRPMLRTKGSAVIANPRLLAAHRLFIVEGARRGTRPGVIGEPAHRRGIPDVTIRFDARRVVGAGVPLVTIKGRGSVPPASSQLYSHLSVTRSSRHAHLARDSPRSRGTVDGTWVAASETAPCTLAPASYGASITVNGGPRPS
jgi:hypothetical protein